MAGRSDLLITQTTDLIATIDRGACITYCTPSVQQILGLPPAGVLGQVLWELVHSDDVTAVHRAIDELFGAGGDVTLTFRMPHVEGGWRTLNASLRLATLEDGVEVAMVAVDVTAARQQDETVKLQQERLQQAEKMEVVGRLAAGIAHDFGNLLTVISGANAQLLEGLPADSALRGRAEIVGENANRAAALVRQLLAFGRRQPDTQVVLDLTTVIGGAEQLLRRLLGEHVLLAVIAAPELWPVRADRTQIEQVLLNLAVNARDSMPTGGRLTIEIRNLSPDLLAAYEVEESGDYVAVSVTDTGIGMDETTRRRAFSAFFTTKPLGRGTGLGLATVQSIVARSDGWIHAASAVGRGTTITFGLPRAASPVAPPARKTKAADTRGGTETVLVVEDEAGVRDLVCDFLGAAGYRVLPASHPADAERIGRDHDGPIDLVLTDVVMPEMSGVQLAERLGAQHGRLRVVFMSGFPEPMVAGELPSGPVRFFVSKPFDRATLLQTVRAALDAEAPAR